MHENLMCEVPYEELMNKAKNKYRLVHMIVKSAKRYEHYSFGGSTDFRENIVKGIDDIVNDKVEFDGDTAE